MASGAVLQVQDSGMRLVIDPPIPTKIHRMAQRVRWQDPFLLKQGIDQTQLVLQDDRGPDQAFSFLVMGDTGTTRKRFDPPQRRVAVQMLEQSQSCRFVLHTGDVVYMVGSSEQYLENFIKPYRGWIVGGEYPNQIPYDQMVFQFPILPVLGNHDYYDLNPVFGVLAQVTWPLRWLLRFPLNLDVGWHGSHQGDAYARAFLDYLQAYRNPQDLQVHLDHHYTAKTDQGRCLCYQPGHFTRLPNRYYCFNYNGIDFFALDSNTFNHPLINPYLDPRRQSLSHRKTEIYMEIARLSSNPRQVDQLDDLYAELELIQEIELDIEKQQKFQGVVSEESDGIDREQLDWLRDRLIQSWRSPQSRGRILYFHHPPYVTEISKWNQGQTYGIRQRLRQVLDQVQQAVGDLTQGRSLVDLVFSGHAHCLEHLRSGETGHGDAHIDWIICGGSGFSLRHQRWENALHRSQLIEQDRVVAESKLFIGRSGHGDKRRKAYSFLRVDISDHDPPQFCLRPYVLEHHQHTWQSYDVDPIHL